MSPRYIRPSGGSFHGGILGYPGPLPSREGHLSICNHIGISDESAGHSTADTDTDP